ncbi:ribosome biogenesis factor YjgA [Celerinatantimonas yamalensis]|uniref:Dual-action ribosomal maturation protein DarP n=1 Tax=Celerinatantimonas yamalensis TaxID=559956 RepID=A0ABW9GAH0_9GAMM
MSDPNKDWQDDDEWISKSELKREAQQLQRLGKKICDLRPAFLATIPLSEPMQEAVALAKRLTGKREALRRHMNYVGKLMRNEDIAAIEQAMEKITNRHLYANQRQHQLEQLRDELINAPQSDDVINALLDNQPQLERQKLRQLIRQAKFEQSKQKAPKSARELFRYLSEQYHD